MEEMADEAGLICDDNNCHKKEDVGITHQDGHTT